MVLILRTSYLCGSLCVKPSFETDSGSRNSEVVLRLDSSIVNRSSKLAKLYPYN